MTRIAYLLCAIAMVVPGANSAQSGYLGFDKNDYPGDASMTVLRKSFRYTSYWLNNPPGFQRNPRGWQACFHQTAGVWLSGAF